MPRTEEANQRIREERRAQILDTAVKVFAHKGLAATRIADIATAGDISQGLIFRYFTSKEEIFGELVERALQATIRQAEEALQQPGTPLEQLRWLLRIYLMGMWYKPEFSLIVQHALHSDATPVHIREMALEQANRSLQIFQRFIVEGQQSGEVVSGDPAMLALVLASSLWGLSSSSLYMPELLNIAQPLDPEWLLRTIRA